MADDGSGRDGERGDTGSEQPGGTAPSPGRGAPGSRERQAEAAPAGGGRPAGGPPRAVYLADLALVGACAWLLWSDWDASRSGDLTLRARTWTFMLNLSCAFVLIHRAMAVVQRACRNPRSARVVGVFKWGFALVVPLAVAAHLEREAQLAHKKNLDALVERIDARVRAAVEASGEVGERDLAAIDSPYLQHLTVRRDTGAYLLRVTLPAVDVDGYTGLYASPEGRWHVHHNDLEPESRPAFDANGPILVCSRTSGTLRCQPS